MFCKYILSFSLFFFTCKAQDALTCWKIDNEINGTDQQIPSTFGLQDDVTLSYADGSELNSLRGIE